MSEHPTHIERREVIQPEPALALTRLLEVDEPDFERDGLPLLWHWLYLLERPSQTDLGEDGHPLRGVIPAPPEAGRRRMWAGGRVQTRAPLRLGVETVRRTGIVSTSHKRGRSGLLTFVMVRHTFEQAENVVVVEEQDIVYRDPAPLTGLVRREAHQNNGLRVVERTVAVDPTLLFRFSALTYNSHRIHYDREYAREVEGYAGLVVHGPLQALSMAESARTAGAAGSMSIDYRLVSPLLEHQGMVVAAASAAESSWDAEVHDSSGRVTARARIISGGPA